MLLSAPSGNSFLYSDISLSLSSCKQVAFRTPRAVVVEIPVSGRHSLDRLKVGHAEIDTSKEDSVEAEPATFHSDTMYYSLSTRTRSETRSDTRFPDTSRTLH